MFIKHSSRGETQRGVEKTLGAAIRVMPRCNRVIIENNKLIEMTNQVGELQSGVIFVRPSRLLSRGPVADITPRSLHLIKTIWDTVERSRAKKRHIRRDWRLANYRASQS